MLNISTARLRALPGKINRTARQARDRFSDLISQARRAVFGQHGHHVVVPVVVPVGGPVGPTVGGPVGPTVDGPVVLTPGTSHSISVDDAASYLSEAGLSEVESGNRSFGSGSQPEESVDSDTAPMGVSTIASAPPAKSPDTLTAMANVHQQALAFLSALKRTDAQDMADVSDTLNQLENEAEQLMDDAQNRSENEKNAAYTQFLAITDAIDEARRTKAAAYFKGW